MADVLEIWNSGEDAREHQCIRHRYHCGRNAIAELLRPRIDGRPKSTNRTNWIEYVTRMHRGFLTYNPIVYTRGRDDQAQALADFSDFRRDSNLDALDGHHLHAAILYGYSAELLNWDGKDRVTATELCPWDVVPVFDENRKVVEAVVKITLKPWSVYEGQMVREPRTLLRHYTATKVTDYELKQGEGEEEGKQTLGTPVETDNTWGVVPVVIFSASQDRESFYSPDFLTQQDCYAVVASALTDDVKNGVDSMLLLKGIKPEQLLQTDANGRSVIDKLRESGLLPVPENGDASYLTRNVDVEKFKTAMSEIRFSIHLQGCVPDLDETISGGEGTITNISGIALKLLFHPMIQQSAEFERWFSAGLRDRIALWNVPRGKMNQPALTSYEIRFKRNLPFNEIEVLQYLPNLTDRLADIDILRALPMVDSPEEALRRLQEQRAARPSPDAPPVPAVAP